jgi:anti-sigma factor RsiW
MNARDRDDEFSEIEELLPWYATGTLSAKETRRVEEALAREPHLRASLQAIREDLEETVALNQALPGPRPGALSRIMAVAEAEPRRPSLVTRLKGVTSRITESFGRAARASPRAFAFAAFVAAVVVIGQAAAIFSLLPHEGSTYSTASKDGPAATREGGFLLVGFAPEASAQQIADLMQRRKAMIVDGPRGGLFRLRVADKPMSKEERDAALAAWRAEPIIRLALPAETR